jgi:hypothetical protein
VKKCPVFLNFVKFLWPRGKNFRLNGTVGECLPKGNPKIYQFKTFFSREKSRVAPPAQPQICCILYAPRKFKNRLFNMLILNSQLIFNFFGASVPLKRLLPLRGT